MNINHPLNVCITESEAALFVLLCDAIFSYHLFINITSVCIIPYKLSAEYIIDKLSAYSIRDDNRKIPIDYGKCHVKHDVTILLT